MVNDKWLIINCKRPNLILDSIGHSEVDDEGAMWLGRPKNSLRFIGSSLALPQLKTPQLVLCS
jgi:hypothetical protein